VESEMKEDVAYSETASPFCKGDSNFIVLDVCIKRIPRVGFFLVRSCWTRARPVVWLPPMTMVRVLRLDSTGPDSP
jgi:hypothetical protein